MAAILFRSDNFTSLEWLLVQGVTRDVYNAFQEEFDLNASSAKQYSFSFYLRTKTKAEVLIKLKDTIEDAPSTLARIRIYT